MAVAAFAPYVFASIRDRTRFVVDVAGQVTDQMPTLTAYTRQLVQSVTREGRTEFVRVEMGQA